MRGLDAELYALFNLYARSAWLFKATFRPPYPRDSPLTIVLEAGCAVRPVSKDAENLALNGFRIPKLPASSGWLYT